MSVPERPELSELRKRAEAIVSPSDESAQTGLSEHEIRQLLHDLNVYQTELEMQNDELRRAQAGLTASLERYSRLFSFAPVGFCVLNDKGAITECNPGLSNLVGWERSRLLRRHFGQLIHPRDQALFAQLVGARVPLQDQEQERALRLLHSDGTTVHALVKMSPLPEPASDAALPGAQGNLLLAVTDLSLVKALTRDNELKNSAIENTLEGVLITAAESNLIVYVNPAFEKTTGYAREEVLGKGPGILRSGKHSSSFYKEMWDHLARQGVWKGEIWNRRKSGEVYPEWLSITVILDDEGRPSHYVGVFSDITAQEELRQRLRNMAYFDELTGLPNRHLLLDRLQQVFADARRNKTPFSLLFMDMDRFKLINDTMGHSAGDRLLVEVSQRIRDRLREIDTLARMGGDEFMVLLPQVETGEGASQVAKKIIASMEQPFEIEGRHYHVTVSIGVSLYPAHGKDAETLIKNADIALYRAKAEGRNTYQVYAEHHNERLLKHVDLENDLRHALVLDTLELHYQPQIDFATRQWTGVEALLRWNHPEKGQVPPQDFIAVAEETGLIVKMGYWVLREACRRYLICRDDGLDMGCVSVNLSPHQFLQGDLVDRVRSILEETGMPPEKLALEVTESAAMPNFSYSVKTLETFRSMGIRVYIDDFGTGFSSLSHLRKLPLDGLKIDRDFVREIPRNGDDVAITKAIIAMAKTLDLEIVAEGIETREQIEFLCREGCNMGQGFFLSKPVPFAQLAPLWNRPPIPADQADFNCLDKQ